MNRVILTKREKYLIKKFKMGYEAWCRPAANIAHLIPGENIALGQHEQVRTYTLERLVKLGYLIQEQDGSSTHNIRGDIRWKIRVTGTCA